MILVIDTSSAIGVLGVLAESGPEKQEFRFDPRQRPDLADQLRRMTRGLPLTKVAVATGPGSFTGLRVGVSFGLGVAMGLRVPIVPLATLPLQAARSDEPVTAVSEAGRGRVYYLAPGGKAAIGEAGRLPTEYELVGWLKPATHSALVAAGLRFKPEEQLRSLVEAAARMLETASEVAYGSLKVEYMQSFSPKSL